MSAQILTALLREPKEVAERCEDPEGLRDLAATSLLCVLVGAAAFGAVVGSFRGGVQIGYSAIKLPLAIVTTLVVTVPAFFSLTIGFGGVSRFRTIAAVALSASARGALVLVACAPVLWLAVDRGLGYHQAVLLAACMYAASGLSALGIVLHGLGGSLRAVVTAAACGVVFFAVLGQTAWMLRPFFGRPAQHAVPFVRAREGTFADALVRSGRSAAGLYDHPSRANPIEHGASSDADDRPVESAP